MPLKGHVIQQHRGSYLKLIFTFKSGSGTDQLDSRDFHIDDLAKVRFKFRIDENGYVQCSVSSMKLPTAKDNTVEMYVSCEDPKYSDSWKCPNEWTDWKTLGNIGNGINSDSESYSMFMVNVHVRKVKEPNPHEKVHEDADFTDFQLCVAGGNVAVHKVFLAAHSEVFKALLNGEWRQADKGPIDIKNVTLQSLQHLKDYLYLGVLPDDGLLTLLLLAKRYLINNLKNDCVMELAQDITTENLYPYLEFACENNIPELAFAILQRTPDDIVHTVSLMKKREVSELSDSAEADGEE